MTVDFRYDSYCGLYCGACEALMATGDGTLESLACELEMEAGDLRCTGCKTQIVSTWCSACDIKGCACDRKVEHCGLCDEFPCGKILRFRNDSRPHHSVVLANLAAIRDEGVEAWLRHQKRRWSCPVCQRSYSWYDESCPECGADVYSCEDEERDLIR